jgi:hypothetical protein
MIDTVLNFVHSFVVAAIAVFGVNMGTEQPKYEVVERLSPKIEIRQYAPRIAAETTVNSEKSDNPRGDAFRLIAGYIFGRNKKNQKIGMTSPVEVQSAGTKIAMTAPVEVDKSNGSTVMRFFMPSQYGMSELPQPLDPRVRLVEIPATVVAALQFSGTTSDEAASAKKEELLLAIKGSKWKPTGVPTALFYNPPWTLPFLRRNEVVVPVSK